MEKLKCKYKEIKVPKKSELLFLPLNLLLCSVQPESNLRGLAAFFSYSLVAFTKNESCSLALPKLN